MTFTLRMVCDNAAFVDVGIYPHVAELLEKAARRITGGNLGGTIIDANGNSVGEWAFHS